MKSLREYLDQLDEISRRDFLKGAGAAAGLAAADAVAAPWVKRTKRDEIDDTVVKQHTVDSVDKRARMYVGPKVQKIQTLDQIEWADVQYGKFFSSPGRIRIGNSAPLTIKLYRPLDGARRNQTAEIEKINLPKILFGLKTPTIVKVELPIYNQGPKVYSFQIEPDTLKEGIRSGLAGAALADPT